MDEAPFGLIEILLGFGVILGWAAWEIRSNRKALEKSRREEREKFHANTD